MQHNETSMPLTPVNTLPLYAHISDDENAESYFLSGVIDGASNDGCDTVAHIIEHISDYDPDFLAGSLSDKSRRDAFCDYLLGIIAGLHDAHKQPEHD